MVLDNARGGSSALTQRLLGNFEMHQDRYKVRQYVQDQATEDLFCKQINKPSFDRMGGAPLLK